ncbi:MAG: HEPN domain-containing protein [archaeon]
MRKEIEDWWKQARKDSNVARKLYEIRKYEHSSFWCQQATEKALKALLLDKKQELIKTHDLVLLAKKLDAPENIVQLCKQLTSVYIETRYPGVSKDGFRKFTKKETEEDIKTMGGILKWVRENL